MAVDESNNGDITTITFVVQKPDNTQSTPRWRMVAVVNAVCPKCRKVMAVMVGDNMYGYCPHCQCYYVAEEGDRT